MENLYTQQRHAQWRGPTTSDDVNTRVEENYKDLVYLYNKTGFLEEDQRRALQRLIKDHFSLSKVLEDLEVRVKTLEAGVNKITLGNDSQVDNDRFNSTSYSIPSVSRLTYDSQHGLVTLPKVESSSLSKMKFTTGEGTSLVPSTFEALVVGDISSADTVGAIIDTSDLYYAVINETGKIWQRNVIVDAPHINGAIITLYVRLPTDLSVVENTNSILVHPFPVMGVDLLDVSYSTKASIVLNEADGYVPINSGDMYNGDTNSVGWVPPGAWNGDIAINARPKTFYFDPKPITGLRIKLRQRHYFKEGAKYLYTYGLSGLDARYDKFLDSGKAIFRFDAKSGETISSVTSINPQIYNVSEAEVPYVFDYQVLWETSLNSGVYTTTPVPLSTRVWVEVTLNKTINKGTPALSGLTLTYS